MRKPLTVDFSNLILRRSNTWKSKLCPLDRTSQKLELKFGLWGELFSLSGLTRRNDAGEKLSYRTARTTLTLEFWLVGFPEWIAMLQTTEVSSSHSEADTRFNVQRLQHQLFHYRSQCIWRKFWISSHQHRRRSCGSPS